MLLLCSLHVGLRTDTKVNFQLEILISNTDTEERVTGIFGNNKQCVSFWPVLSAALVTNDIRLTLELWEWPRANWSQRHIPSQIINRAPAGTDKPRRCDRNKVWQHYNVARNSSSYADNWLFFCCRTLFHCVGQPSCGSIKDKECQGDHN